MNFQTLKVTQPSSLAITDQLCLSALTPHCPSISSRSRAQIRTSTFGLSRVSQHSRFLGNDGNTKPTLLSAIRCHRIFVPNVHPSAGDDLPLDPPTGAFSLLSSNQHQPSQFQPANHHKKSHIVRRQPRRLIAIRPSHSPPPHITPNH